MFARVHIYPVFSFNDKDAPEYGVAVHFAGGMISTEWNKNGPITDVETAKTIGRRIATDAKFRNWQMRFRKHRSYRSYLFYRNCFFSF